MLGLQREWSKCGTEQQRDYDTSPRSNLHLHDRQRNSLGLGYIANRQHNHLRQRIRMDLESLDSWKRKDD